MSRFFKKSGKKPGLPPGTLIHVGNKRIEKARMTVINYSGKHLEEKELKKIEDCFHYRDRKTVTWINIDGLHETDVIQKIGDNFRIHPLVLEDIVNTDQRPKLEDFDDYIFVTIKMLYSEQEGVEIHSEQISLIIGPKFVITFQERVGDVFEPVRERIRKSKGKFINSGPDYLFYALIDAVVDNYFNVLEKIGEKIEDLEKELLRNPTNKTLAKIHSMKRELILLRKSVWPLRETISSLTRGDNDLIEDQTNIYLRDVYDHTIQVIDTIETLKETVSGMLDTYLSSLSNRMNEVMKVLTIIATIFIPLTFIAGIYGMNFDFMPELRLFYGYFAVWGVMMIIALIMVLYFKRKDWI